MTACAMPGYLPRFQKQLRSDDPYGGMNCTAYAAAMAGDFDTCGVTVLTGEQVRALSDEPHPDPASPGLNLAQVDAALNHRGIDLEVRYRLPWDDFARKINKGEGAILQIDYGPIADSRFDAGRGFRGGHAMFVPPGWGVMDPLADGRALNVYQYQGEPYPHELLKRAAGELVLSQESGHKIRLGYGSVYAAFTRDRRSTWTWEIDPAPGQHIVEFVIWRADEANRTCTPVRTQRSRGTEPRQCTPPRLYRSTRDGSSRSLVRLLAGAYAGHYVHSRYATEVP